MEMEDRVYEWEAEDVRVVRREGCRGRLSNEHRPGDAMTKGVSGGGRGGREKGHICVVWSGHGPKHTQQ